MERVRMMDGRKIRYNQRERGGDILTNGVVDSIAGCLLCWGLEWFWVYPALLPCYAYNNMIFEELVDWGIDRAISIYYNIILIDWLLEKGITLERYREDGYIYNRSLLELFLSYIAYLLINKFYFYIRVYVSIAVSQFLSSNNYNGNRENRTG